MLDSRQKASVNPLYDVIASRFADDEGALNNTGLSWFIETHALPLVGIKAKENRMRYEDTSIPELTVFAQVDLKKNANMLKYYTSRIAAVAAQKEGQMTFNIVDPRQFGEEFLSSYDISSFKRPIIGIRQNNIYFTPTEEFTFSEEALKQFIRDVESGKVAGKPKRSSSRSSDGDADFHPFVAKLTDTTFNAVVHGDTSTDVLIEFFAPWCGHCRKLKPEYELVAEMFRDESGIVVAAMDATKNTIPLEYSVKVYGIASMCDVCNWPNNIKMIF